MSALTAADSARSMAAEVLQSSGILRIGVTGSSMLPALWPGDIVTIVAGTDQPRVGEVILFQRCDQFVIHRVVRVASSEGQTQILTRGDCMNNDDRAIAASEVLGRVASVRRGSHEFSLAPEQPLLQKSLGWLLSRFDFLSNLALRWHAARRTRWEFAPTISEGTR